MGMDRAIHAIGIIKKAALDRDQRQADRILQTAQILRDNFTSWAKELRCELKLNVQQISQLGWPPSFVIIAGQSNLEKPFNRLIKWWTMPDSEHGLSQAFLIELSRLVDLPEMIADLEQGECPVVHSEEAVEETNGRQPDLFVQTSHAALMLENKVNAPESGDQYGPYLRYFNAWAGSNRKKCAVLCSRDIREIPSGWNKCILHGDLAQILYRISDNPKSSDWGRISAIICAVTFENDPDICKKYEEAKRLLAQTEGGMFKPQTLHRMAEILPITIPPSPIRKRQ